MVYYRVFLFPISVRCYNPAGKSSVIAIALTFIF